MTHKMLKGLAKGTPNGMFQVMTYGKQKGKQKDPQGHTIGHTKRREAKESNWPLRNQNPGRRDRISWIANSLRRSCLAANKFSEPGKCEFE